MKARGDDLDDGTLHHKTSAKNRLELPKENPLLPRQGPGFVGQTWDRAGLASYWRSEIADEWMLRCTLSHPGRGYDHRRDTSSGSRAVKHVSRESRYSFAPLRYGPARRCPTCRGSAGLREQAAATTNSVGR